MANKFNIDFMKGNAPPTNDKTKSGEDALTKFKSAKEIFDKADNAIDSIALDKLIPFENHPFQIREGERLNELTASIQQQGVLVPCIVRVHPQTKGCYEILAGHHRQVAAQRAGLTDVPCIIKNVDDNTAVLIVVESNKQRGFADMLPSEIAKALKMEYDALKHQGKRTDLLSELESLLSDDNLSLKTETNTDDNGILESSGTMCQKLTASEKIGESTKMSDRNIRYYIRLNYLIPPLLDLVDDDKIAIRPAVDLSYLKESEQQDVYAVMEEYNCKVDMKKSEKLKEYAQAGRLTKDTALLILSGTIFETKAKKITTLKFPIKKIQSYFPAALPQSEYEGYVLKAVEFYRDNSDDE